MPGIQTVCRHVVGPILCIAGIGRIQMAAGHARDFSVQLGSVHRCSLGTSVF